MDKTICGQNFYFLLILCLTQICKGVTFRDGDNRTTGFCGILYSGHNFEGQAFPLEDQDQSVHLLEDERALDYGWNSTQSLVVEKKCQLKTCNDTYFDGTCKTFEPGFYSGDLLPSSIASVACTCPQKCKCSDIHIKKLHCGRAYLEGGCSTCHTLYTDLRVNSTQSIIFPPGFVKKVEAFRLRKGCKLTTYLEEEFEGDETVIDQEIVEDFQGEIGSYQCECNDALYTPRTKPPRPEQYPTLLDVPTDMNQMIEMLATDRFRNHPGLNSARRSYRNKRSSRNAYILLLGSTGAGKSSAINFLFDNPNITKVGDVKSTTSSIHEFRITVPIDELGIANSELRVIDTPGMGDTRGVVHDAKYLATLDNYLSTHEELKDRLPNVVLIFHKFHDNRFSGEGANFVKMIRGIDYFRERITDQKYSNVIFVFSHYMSVSKALQRKPESRINDFRKVIQDYSLYPRPTHIVVAENNARDEDLPIANGYYQLPNYDYYPRNLFEKLELITEKCGDPIGQGVFKTAFRDSENFNVSSTTHNLISSTTNEVQWFLGLLNNANLNINNTEVSQHLQQVWDNDIDTKLKREYPYSLAYLQKALNLRHINSLQDVPRTTPKILDLLAALKHDPATRSLLDKGLTIQSPIFSQNTIAGYGYHVFQDAPLAISPLQLGDLKESDAGFRIPSSISCILDPGTKEHFMVFENKNEYLRYRLQTLGIDGTISLEQFTDKVQPGCNIKEKSFPEEKPDRCSITATKEFRLFQMTVNDKPKLNPEFESAVRNLTSFNNSDPTSVTNWTKFFNTYGTHVVWSVYWGGSLQLEMESSKPFSSEFAVGIFNLIKFFEDLTYDMEYAGNDERNVTDLHKSGNVYPQSTRFVGGDPEFHSTDIGKMHVTEASKLLSNWKKSLRLSPSALATEMRLVPISRLASGLGQNYTMEIEQATKLLFNSDLVYKPPVSKKLQGPGLARDDTPVLVELMKMMQDQSQQFQSIMLEFKKAEAENEQRRLKMEEERLEWQRQQAKENAEFRLSQAEIARKNDEAQRRYEERQEQARMQHEKNIAMLMSNTQQQNKQSGFGLTDFLPFLKLVM